MIFVSKKSNKQLLYKKIKINNLQNNWIKINKKILRERKINHGK